MLTLAASCIVFAAALLSIFTTLRYADQAELAARRSEAAAARSEAAAERSKAALARAQAARGTQSVDE